MSRGRRGPEPLSWGQVSYPCTVGWRFPRERPESSGASPGFGTYIGPEVLEDTTT